MYKNIIFVASEAMVTSLGIKYDLRFDASNLNFPSIYVCVHTAWNGHHGGL